MKYETAVKLLKAGFPFEPADGIFMVKEPQDDNEAWFEYPLGDVYWKPSLEELIEACGDNFQDLCRGLNGVWSCVSFNHVFSKGETPTEAVANLLLALKNKKI